MKRHGNLFEKISDIDNILLAHQNARKGKIDYSEVEMVDKNPLYYTKIIKDMLDYELFDTSEYEIFTINDSGKEREIYKLPYFPDRIIHWAIMQIIEPLFLNTFIHQTYAALPEKGVHSAMRQLDKYMMVRDENLGLVKNENAQYCLKIDVKKFFPNIDKEILKKLLERKIKDKKLLSLLENIIDSVENGVPIGNYLSQYWGNFYLSYFDHWIKHEKKIKYYIRYMDDMVILHHSKEYLHKLKREIDIYFHDNLKLEIKDNWQVFPTFVRGIDFVGFRHFGEYVLLRKNIAKNLKKKMRKILKKCREGRELTYSEWCSINSYKGWTMHCNGHNLTEKYIYPLRKYEREYYFKHIKNKGKNKNRKGEKYERNSQRKR